MPYDYYEPKLVDEPINVALNEAIERAMAGKAELPRPYLGASIAGSECLRRVQYDWWCTPALDARTRAIFARGHYFEARVREQLVAAGFKFAPPEVGAFKAVNGDLRGHADGVIIAGPNPLGSAYINYPFLWECKALNAKNWRALARNKLEKEFPRYAAQLALYQAYLKLTNPALFSAVNVDTCEQLHFWAPFNAERAQLWSDRAANIIAGTRAGDLLPRGYSDPDKFPCKILPPRFAVLAMSAAHKKTLEERLANLIRLLSSDKDGEVLATVHALKRTLESAGTDMNGFAHGIENLGKSTVIPDEIKKKIWDAAVQHTENRLHGADDFASTDGKPTWQAVALYCQRNINRLDTRHHDFINKVAAQTVYDQEPTERMHKYLFSLFLRLGGKIT